MASKLGCVLEKVLKLKVSAANGEELKCTEMCRGFSWVMQGQRFKADVLALQLENYDLVLGVQWLVELGDIVWNFKELQMKFKRDGKDYMLQGNKGIQQPLLTIPGDKMDKVLVKTAQLSLLQCYELQWVRPLGDEYQEKEGKNCGDREVPGELQAVLEEFEDVFQEPTQLPPQRIHDHKIILVERAQPVNIKPYKYGSL